MTKPNTINAPYTLANEPLFQALADINQCNIEAAEVYFDEIQKGIDAYPFPDRVWLKIRDFSTETYRSHPILETALGKSLQHELACKKAAEDKLTAAAATADTEQTPSVPTDPSPQRDALDASSPLIGISDYMSLQNFRDINDYTSQKTNYEFFPGPKHSDSLETMIFLDYVYCYITNTSTTKSIKCVDAITPK